MPTLTALPAFNDNYIWALDNGEQCLVVDPGDPQPVIDFLLSQDLTLTALLITHHHPDHVGGISTLKQQWPELTVYGPAQERIPERTISLNGGETITPTGFAESFDVIAVPGHTLGHIAYLSKALPEPILFCGDTLFSGGCGRLFEGTPAQMLASLDSLAALPDHTQVCCAHEYTQANLRFAKAVLPDDPAVEQRAREVDDMRANGQSTLPVPLAEEKASNLFLRIDDPALIAQLKARDHELTNERSDLFASLRSWKDTF